MLEILDARPTLPALPAEPPAPPAARAAAPALSEEQRHQLVVEWNDSAMDLPRRCLHELIEAQADRDPQAVAVVCDGTRLSYGELEIRANRLAHHLRSLGVAAGDLVGLCAERSLELVVGVLGILKAGAAYVPIDPEYPEERISFLLEDAAVPVLLTQERLAEKLAAARAAAASRLLRLDADWPAVAGESGGRPAGGARPGDLAYVIFTSGSTGRPKGVMVHHGGVVNRLLWARSTYPVTPQDRVLQKAAASFDASVWELFVPLVAGARLILARPGGHRDPAYLVRTIREQEVTLLRVVPSLLQMLVAEEGFAQCSSLRALFSSGEALPPDLAECCLSRLPVLLRNQYGPSEVSITATSWLCRREDSSRGFMPIGRPLGNVAVHVLDEHLDPVPAGVPGELFVGGSGVARGYLRRPDLTAEKFLPDPFSRIPGARLYRTGDQALRLPDGNLKFLGRTDHQVKIRGFRVELGEIEAALRTHPRLREAAVLASARSGGDLRLVAYVVAEAGAPPADELRALLGQTLPDYMIPAAFVVLPALPRNPHGKLDRRALPEVEVSRPVAPADARTPIEELVSEVWAGVLECGSVGMHDDFFALGGHSLLAGQAVSRLRAALDVEIPVSALFEHPTPARLAGVIEARMRGGRRTLPPLEPVPRTGALPASYAQEGLWLYDQLEPGSNAFNIGYAVRFTGSLSVAALDGALAEILRRHEVLRTRFVAAGQLLQVIDPPPPHPLAVADLSGLPASHRDRAAQEGAAALRSAPFDLGHGPLLRAALLRLTPDDHIFSLTIHHILSDGWSRGVLIHETRILYGAFSSAAPSPLPELPVQYADFAVWQRRRLQGELLEEQLGVWQKQLAGDRPIAILPVDRPASPGGGVLAQTRRAISPDLLELLLRLGRSEGATLFMTLLAALKLLLFRLTGCERIGVGSMHANRMHSALEGVIGYFANVLPLHTTVAPEWTFRELLSRVRDTALEAYAHHDTPYEKILARVSPDRSAGRNALFQVLAILHNMPVPPLSLPGLQVAHLDLDQAVKRASFDLTLTFVTASGELLVWAEYDRDLFNSTTVDRLLDHFERILRDVADDPGQRIADLPRGLEAQGLLWLTDPEPAGDPAALAATARADARVEEKAALIRDYVAARRSKLSDKQRALLRQRLATH